MLGCEGQVGKNRFDIRRRDKNGNSLVDQTSVNCQCIVATANCCKIWHLEVSYVAGSSVFLQ